VFGAFAMGRRGVLYRGCMGHDLIGIEAGSSEQCVPKLELGNKKKNRIFAFFVRFDMLFACDPELEAFLPPGRIRQGAEPGHEFFQS